MTPIHQLDVPAAWQEPLRAPPHPRPQSAAGERRRRPRVSASFAVTLAGLAGGLGRGRLHGAARDYDVEGACIRVARPVEAGRRLKVKMKLPRSISSVYHGLPCEVAGRVRSVREAESGGRTFYDLVVRWNRPLDRSVGHVIRGYRRQIGVFIGLVMFLIVWLKWSSLRFFWYSPLFYVYSVTLLTYLISRFFISWRHESPPMTDYEPTVSIVISVRNEEKAIGRTIDHCFETEYPSHKREVIVVDDGSTDGTARVLKELMLKYPDLKAFSIPAKGKRYGMATGVLKASGELIVFVDSDTFLTPGALRHIVCGFEDPTLGASSGYAEVDNADVNVLTGLQEVRYYVSFRLLKTSESVFNAVTCCPGCLSAYRRSYVMEVLEPWLKQRFLGAPATFGDDRSLTNYILRKYRVIYNDQAVATTLVPETWTQYLHQQLRWKKSWLRETPIAARFMFKKHPLGAISFYAAAVFSMLSPLMVVRVLYLGFAEHQSIFLTYVLGLVLVGLLQSLYYLYKRPSPHWMLGLLWMASSMLLTGPQTYYALLTMRKNHWGTR